MTPLSLSELDAMPRWVTWRNENQKGRLRKVPYDPHAGTRAASDDPATWGTKGHAQSLARKIVNGDGGGIGIMLGRLHDGRAIGGVDLDTCRAPDGSFLPWALDVMRRLSSYCEISPSQTGAKIFFVYDSADLPALRTLTRTDWGKSWKLPGAPAHPPAIELHLGNRYFTVTGQQLDLGPSELCPVPLATLQWLITEAGPGLIGKPPRNATPRPARKPPDGDRSRPELAARIKQATAQHPLLSKRWGGDWAGLNDASQSGMAMALGAALVRAGFSFDDMCAALALHSDTADWAGTKGADGDGRELHRIFDKADAGRDARPDLVVQGANLPATAQELRDVIAASGRAFDRGGVPVLLRWPADGGLPVAQRLNANAVVTLAHDLCRPVRLTKDGERIGLTLPERVAHLYLALDSWNLRPLNGITSAPLLHETGAIAEGNGYDSRMGIWCARVPGLAVPERPSKAEAQDALALLRETFRTFCFANAIFIERNGLAMVDTSKPAGLAESSFLCGLLTGVCRPSLWLAPGLCVAAPELTGSGAGKGLLVRAICAIAYGIRPAPFTAGHNRDELDKRLVSELIEARPVTFLDNVNGVRLRSDTLASVLTERPASVRVMGTSQSMPLNCAGLIAVTGNGLSVSEDLVRRFLVIELAPQCEDAETRPYPPGFLRDIFARRGELLSAALTIWRWGRQSDLKPGLVLASYEDWGRWCRDPLIALGCNDPVEQVRQAKQVDPKRRFMAELFACWHIKHGTQPVTAAKLEPEVAEMLDPQNRGRQFITNRVRGMIGTRAAGFVLTFQASTGKWTAGTYALAPAPEPVAPAVAPPTASPMTPTPPMPMPHEAGDSWQGEL